MRVRIVRNVNSSFGCFVAGQTANIPDIIAQYWLEAGIAEQVKLMDPPEETKVTRKRRGQGKR